MTRIGSPCPDAIRRPACTGHTTGRNAPDPFLFQRANDTPRRDLSVVIVPRLARRKYLWRFDNVAQLRKAIVPPRENISPTSESQRVILAQGDRDDGMW